MRIVFMGTPEFSVPVLQSLIASHEVVAVYTREPKESGRGKKVNKTPIHLLAESNNIEVRHPRTLRDKNEQDILKSFNADVAIVAAYGMLLPKEVLEMFPFGCINVHASILPRWRGAAPIQRAVEAGDEVSGISIMQMVEALDAGDVLGSESVTITDKMTGGELHDKLSELSGDLLLNTLKNFDTITPIPQDESKVLYAKKIDKAECLLNFSETTDVILRKIRAFSPYPSMYFMYKDERFKILEAEGIEHCGESNRILKSDKELVITTKDGAIKVLKIQRQGKQAMCIGDLLRGFQFEIGEKV
ncbi:MAG: methionyl-tRNA formyltransferase [Alphaproteobacteria bacterium]|nr:methionyl-tRNA formyltransferase [Alphaproteobacteria bacterium]